MTALTIETVARQLCGKRIGRDQVLVPGPGHGPRDRSLAIKLDPRAPLGFVCYSHAGDDPMECRDHVAARLGLDRHRPARSAATRPTGDGDAERIARARHLWG